MIHHTINGQSVPALGMGTWQLRGDACRLAVEHAIDIGYRHIDTAQAYDNEADVGQGIHNAGIDRDQLFVTTKIWHDALRPPQIMTSTEESLRKLQLDYVDLLLIHWPNQDIPLADTLGAMQALLDQGKTRHIGVSNFPSRLLKQAIELAPIFCDQVEYHPYLSQQKLLGLVTQHNLLLTAYCPIARARVMDDAIIRQIAETHGKTPIQITLRWLVQQQNVAAIPKAASAKHREANLAIFDFELTEDEMRTIHQRQSGVRICNPDFAPAWDAN